MKTTELKPIIRRTTIHLQRWKYVIVLSKKHYDIEILDQSKEQVVNNDERTTKDKVSAVEMKLNSGNTMLDSSAKPVVTDDRNVSMLDSSAEPVVIDDRTQKLNNGKDYDNTTKWGTDYYKMRHELGFKERLNIAPTSNSTDNDRIVGKENICNTQKINNDKEITEISTASGGNDDRSAAEENMVDDQVKMNPSK